MAHSTTGGLSRSLVGVFSSLVEDFRSRGFSSVLANHPYAYNGAKLLLIGPVIEAARRLFRWVLERFRFRYSVSARFSQGDPAFEWLTLFMTTERVWRTSRDFTITAKNSKRKWAVNKGTATAIDSDNADYVPLYDGPQLFRWRGYWLEVQDNQTQLNQTVPYDGPRPPASLSVTIYTLDISVLSRLVEEARLRYLEASKPHVTVYSADAANYGHVFNSVKMKPRRPLNTLILEDGVIESLIDDAIEFIKMEDWYIEAGIPHRRGYLLHGPPGVGKTSTIYAIAGELGLEIYSLSLASAFCDDSFLQRAMSSIPKRSIVLIEDIDCAFLPRDENTGPPMAPLPPMPPLPPWIMPPVHTNQTIDPNCRITLSGLLNMLDGVGSEEGKLFFATTNHIDRLDPALLRPGRIDKKIQYYLSNTKQARALFERFYPEHRFGSLVGNLIDDIGSQTQDHPMPSLSLAELAEHFASSIPENQFSTAQLQGYLLMCKMQPLEAASGIKDWVKSEQEIAREKEERDRKSKWSWSRANGNESGVIPTSSDRGTGSPGSAEVDQDAMS